MTKIFDRSLLRLHRNRIINSISYHDFLLRFAADNLFDKIRIIDSQQKFNNILEIGCRSGILTSNLSELFDNLIVVEISKMLLSENLFSKNKLVADEEMLPFQMDSFDLIVSLMNMHWINDIQNFLLSIRSILKNEGVFIANFFGGSTLENFRKKLIQAESLVGNKHCNRLSPMIRLEDVASIMQQTKFSNIVVDTTLVEVEYKNPLKLMYDLRYMAENSCFISREIFSKVVLEKLHEIYVDQIEKFEIITIKASVSKI